MLKGGNPLCGLPRTQQIMVRKSSIDAPESIESWDQGTLDHYAREYRGALSRYFSRRGAPSSAIDDLVQEVFVRLARLAQKSVIDNGEAYLMRTASTVWIDHLRKQQRMNSRVHFEYDDEQHSPAGISPERALESKQSLDRVVAALEALPTRTRQIYLLCRVDGRKRRSVAEQMGITVSAVDKQLMSAAKAVGLAASEEG